MPLESSLLPGAAIVPLEIALAHLALCIFIILRRWLNDTTGRLFVAYLFLTALWDINLAAIGFGRPTLLPTLSRTQLAFYSLIVMGAVYWTFARAFLQREWISPWSWAAGLIALVVAAVLGSGRWVGTLVLPSGADIRVRTFALLVSVAAWLVFMMLAAVTAEIQQFRTASPAHKNRIHYLALGTLTSIVGYVLVLSPPPILDMPGLAITLLSAGLLTYTLIVEDLLDLGIAARQTTSALVIGLVTFAVFTVTIFLAQRFLRDQLTSVDLLSFNRALLVAVLASVLLTVVYTPIRQVSQRLATRILLGKNYDYSAVIHHYSHATSNLLYLNQLAAMALGHIGRTLGVERGALLILDSESRDQLHLRILPALGGNDLPPIISLSKETPVTQRLIQEEQALAQYTLDISRSFAAVPRDEYQSIKALSFEWYVPILKNKQLIGAFALGPKRSGQPYSIQDLSLLGTLADQTALALENAALFDRLRRNLAQTTHMKNLMNNVFDSIDNGVITMDVFGQITLINRAAESILGLPPQDCLGQHYAKALPALTYTALPHLINNVLDHKAHYSNYELVLDLPHRGRVTLSVHLTPVKSMKKETGGVAIVVEDLTETKRLRAVQDMFRRYLSPAVVDRLPMEADDLKLGGHRQEVTILFADIRDFTAFSEKVAPEALVDVLNRYLSTAAASILMYEGTLDKFMGDAVMGIFNAPLKQEDHVLRAVRAAAALQRAITDYHHNIGERHGLRFGVGIHTGEAVVGNVGMPDRMDYTVVGDVVNVTKRIQENAPGGKILLSEQVYQRVKGSAQATFYAEMNVKGREQLVKTYELKWI